MSVFEVTTRISHKWLERKPKHELASIIMANIDHIDLFAEQSDKAIERELVTALEGIMALIGSGKLVRNTSEDAHPDWAMRQLPFVQALSAADQALRKARGEAITEIPA